MYIILSLKQDLYLGIDFKSAFELLSFIMHLDELASDAHILSGLGKTSFLTIEVDESSEATTFAND